MRDFKLRTESIKDDEILELAVKNPLDERIINSLTSSEPCLLEGSRGTGKSFLMKIAEIELGRNDNILPVFITFNVSSLINTNDNLQFYHWMLAKTLRALLNKLRKKGLSLSVFSKNLLSNDSHEKDIDIELSLKNIVNEFESSYMRNDSNININTLPDIEDVKEAIKDICENNNLERIFFFFDEAAHVFRPEQQRQFFNLFKDLRSPFITCKAAIYPGVTHFGKSFEPTHDCIYEILDRDISETQYLDYFSEIVFKQADEELVKSMENQRELFNTLALASGGNPRILLKTIQELSKFNTTEVDKIIREFYRVKIWSEHTDLGEKYNGHKYLIDWGRNFLEKIVIPTLSNNEKSTIYFWVNKDIPEAVKESLRLLTYTGIIRKIDSGIKSHGQIGTRYEVKYGFIIALQSNPSSFSKDFIKKLSIKQFTEFGKNHGEYDNLKDVSPSILEGIQYSQSLESLLKRPIDVLGLTDWQKNKLREANILTIEDLYSLQEEDLIEKIYQVGKVRARLIKNAADSEILEYISG